MLVPGWLSLDSLSIIRLAALLLSLLIAVYLVLVPKKSLATLFLAGVFAGAFLFNISQLFEFAGPLYWQPRTPKTVLVLLLNGIGPSLAMIFLLLFAYHYPRFRQAERKEFGVVLGLSIALNTGVLGLNVYNHFVLQWHFSDMRLWNIYWLVYYCSLGAQFVGAIVLLFRKAARLSGHGHRSLLARIIRPTNHDARSARVLGVILLLPVLAIGASLASTYGALSFSLASYLTWLGLLLFYLGFVVTYLNHTPDPVTLQLKLLGMVLVLILGTMGLVALFAGETSVRDYPRRPPLPEHSTVRFTPNGFASYDIRRTPDTFDADLGPRLDIVYGRPRVVPLEFDFPFFAERYRTIHILNGPMIFLGERTTENGWGGYNPQPAIAPLIVNLDPSRRRGGVHLKSSPTSVTITWYALPELESANRNTIQLALHADGSIEMSFEELSSASGPSVAQLYDYTAASTTGATPARDGRPAPFPPRLTGIHPGTRNAPLQPISFTHGLPWSGRGPAVIFESHEAGFAHHLNDRIATLAALTIGASLVVLFLAPLLLQAILFTPLRALSQGMRAVERGEPAASVRVQSSDEIGSLARSFNSMVEAIGRAETTFRTLADDAQDGIIVFSDDRAVYANRRAAAMTGLSAPELPRVPFGTLFRSAALPPYGVQPDAPVEALAVTALGARLPVELVYSRTLWRGRPAIAVLVRDITRRKRDEDAARLQEQKLVRMEKLTSLGVLSAGLAHEISAPNHVILQNAALLSAGLPQLAALLPAAVEQAEGRLIAGLDAAEFLELLPGMLSAVLKSSGVIDGIIRNMRDFGLDSPGGAAPFDVNTAINNAVGLLGASLRRATDRFTLELDPRLPPARGNRQRIEQVLINLILNACQSLGCREQAITVSSRPGRVSATVEVIVRDEGAGIPADVLPRVREAFFTTREADGGTGLGLYVSQAIVSAHGGTLELSSSPGEGTAAVVILPAEAEA